MRNRTPLSPPSISDLSLLIVGILTSACVRFASAQSIGGKFCLKQGVLCSSYWHTHGDVLQKHAACERLLFFCTSHFLLILLQDDDHQPLLLLLLLHLLLLLFLPLILILLLLFLLLLLPLRHCPHCSPVTIIHPPISLQPYLSTSHISCHSLHRLSTPPTVSHSLDATHSALHKSLFPIFKTT